MTQALRKAVLTSANTSIKKYHKAYELLEEYDRKALSNPEDLAEPGRLRDRVQRLQRS